MAGKAEEALRRFAALCPKLEAEHCRPVHAPAPSSRVPNDPAPAPAEELRARLGVSDVIVRRLHAKNKLLLRRLAAAEANAQAGTRAASRQQRHNAADPEEEQLHSEIDAARRGDRSAAEMMRLLERAQRKMRSDALRHREEMLQLRNTLQESSRRRK